MNLHDILQSAVVARLGWTLLHSLWQGAAVALLLAGVRLVLRRNGAQSRYAASCCAMLFLAISPLVTFAVLGSVASTILHAVAPMDPPSPVVGEARLQNSTFVGGVEPSRKDEPRRALHEPSAGAATAGIPIEHGLNSDSSMKHRTQDLLPWLVLAWAIGVLLMSLWNLGGWLALQRLKTLHTRAAADDVIIRAQRLCTRLGLERPVRLLESALVGSPMVIGAFKPIILLSASVLCELPASQLESILAHELAHVRRHDYLVNLFQSVIETLLFYHPAVWWVSRRIRGERENCCDDLALSVTSDRAEYARALAAVASLRGPALAPAASGGVLLSRVRRVLEMPDMDAGRSPRWVAGAVALIGILMIGTIMLTLPARGRAQQPNTPPSTRPTGIPAATEALRKLSLDVILVDQKSKKPLANAPVAWSGGQWTRENTDAKGHVHLEFDASNESMIVWARPAGYVPTVLNRRALEREGPLPASFTFPIEPGTTIGGTVLDEQGKPIAGATVRVSARRTGDDTGQLIHTQVQDDAFKTDPLGKWTCDNVQADPVQISIRLSHPDFASDEMYGQSSKPTLEQLRNGTAVSIMTKGVRVAGRVLDVDGKPIQGANVALGQVWQFMYGLQTPQSDTDAAGRFNLPHCRPHQLASLTGSAKGHAPQMKQFQLDGDTGDLEFRLAPPRPLMLRIVDAEGRALPDTRLFIQDWRGMHSLNFDTHSDVDGRIVWPEAPYDAVRYCVAHNGYIQLSRSIEATALEQTIILTPQLRITGTIVDDQTGKLINKFHVRKGFTSIRGEALSWESDIQTEARVWPGGFELTDDSAHTGYAVPIEADGYQPADSREIGSNEKDVTLSFRLIKAADLSATFVTPNDPAAADRHDRSDVLSASRGDVNPSKPAPRLPEIAPDTRPFDPAAFERLSDEAKRKFVLDVVETRERELSNYSYELTQTDRNVPDDPRHRSTVRDDRYEYRRLGNLQSVRRSYNQRGIDFAAVATWDGRVGKCLQEKGQALRPMGVVSSDASPIFRQAAFAEILGSHIMSRDSQSQNFAAFLREFAYRVIVEHRDGRPELRVFSEQADGFQKIFWLDPDRGYMIDRVERRRESDNVYARLYNLMGSEEVRSAVKIGGVWFPMEVVERAGPSPNLERVTERVFEVTEFQLGQLKQTDVEIVFPKDTEVYDQVLRVRYVREPNGRFKLLPFTEREPGAPITEWTEITPPPNPLVDRIDAKTHALYGVKLHQK